MTATGNKRDPLTEDQVKLKTAHTQRWTAILGSLTAVLTLVAGGLGVYAAVQVQQKGQAQDVADRATDKSVDLTGEVAALKSEKAELENQVGDLTQKNEELVAENDGLREGSGSSASPTSAASPTVRHEGELVVTAASQYADLDVDATDAQWGRAERVSSSEITDINSKNELFISSYSLVSKVDEGAGYLDCKSANNPVRGATLSVAQMSPGYTLCVRTDKRRTALLVVRSNAMSRTSPEIVFDVTVWDDAPA